MGHAGDMSWEGARSHKSKAMMEKKAIRKEHRPNQSARNHTQEQAIMSTLQ